MAIVKNGQWIAIDSVETDNTLSGTGRPGEPLGVNGELGIRYEGIEPVIVDNDNNTIAVESDELKVQHPITFNKNTTTIGFDNSIIPDSYTKTESDNKYALKDDVPKDVYTKSEADEKFQEKLTDYTPNIWNSKQDNISDLETIRNNAALGATAVQPDAISDMLTKTEAVQTYQPKGDYALKSELETVETDINDKLQLLYDVIDTKVDLNTYTQDLSIINDSIDLINEDIEDLSVSSKNIESKLITEINDREASEQLLQNNIDTKVSKDDFNTFKDDITDEFKNISETFTEQINDLSGTIDNVLVTKLDTAVFEDTLEIINDNFDSIDTDIEKITLSADNLNSKIDEEIANRQKIDNELFDTIDTKVNISDFNEFVEEDFEYKENNDVILEQYGEDIDSLSATIDTKQDILIAGKNIDITDNTVSVKDTIGLFVDDTLVVKSQNEDKLLGINKNILTNVNQDEIKTDVINVSTEDDYLKIELTDENSNKIYGGIIGDHNIKKENAGKILRINADGNALELVAQSSGGLAYNIIDSSDFQHEQNVNVALNAFNDCGVIPNIVKHLNFFFEKPLEPDVMPRGMIHFELPFDTQLLDVNVFYRLNDEEYMECNYSFLNEKDTKVPIYFKPNHLYQISLTNHNAAFYDFSDNVNEKKNFIQLWYLDPNSKLLHHFPIEESDETEIKNGTPYDEIGFENKIKTIDRNNIFEYSHTYDNTEGQDSIGLSNIISKIDIIPIFEHKNLSNKYDTVGFDNKIETINRKDIYQYYSKSTDTYSIGNELIDCIKKEEFGYTKEYISDNCSFGNKLEKLEIETVEIDGYSRS